ncbi:dTDP-4-dehydrorhamnose reductase [Flammeovirga kamogawensis]|uniref:dTDP-4-dehydrorhamnose reductase n=1 Tax=Flammeovirga kamogawensis TaxID=373891 RepID=A0ABX8GU05_9BACT|nr:dTDP-4-dehydrorhamnose reductase [Flammeovirga kamogawensis]MBB6461519.1 dTDP-4-dehydrorhamnose reductase [Flammeovirga kamogawensis]QWG06410.1 dTDP-4-dehydrorhamnose reductase [Flammeovirga kamogawensis]TRX68240.1 dTDP-4-dehydrorhamnose reductase [Flammeovirga kamogawensis]
MQKEILVTGARGQLGSELNYLTNTIEAKFTFVDLDELDITNQQAINIFFRERNFTHCINCAAYTAVDKAETDRDIAYKVNVLGVKNLAEVCKENNIVLFHVSTDFVFDGNQITPYSEEIIPSPISVYGETKLEGENEVIKTMTNYFIIRTAWLYSSFGNNFVKTMLRLANEKDELGVIVDQIGTPTYARDLAKAILLIIDQESAAYGVYHYSNEGVASWYDFAQAIFILSKTNIKVNPLHTSAYPTPAKRPKMSVMDKSKFTTSFNITIPYWQSSLIDCLKVLGDK